MSENRYTYLLWLRLAATVHPPCLRKTTGQQLQQSMPITVTIILEHTACEANVKEPACSMFYVRRAPTMVLPGGTASCWGTDTVICGEVVAAAAACNTEPEVKCNTEPEAQQNKGDLSLDSATPLIACIWVQQLKQMYSSSSAKLSTGNWSCMDGHIPSRYPQVCHPTLGKSKVSWVSGWQGQQAHQQSSLSSFRIKTFSMGRKHTGELQW